jgi:hypothetical protein
MVYLICKSGKIFKTIVADVTYRDLPNFVSVHPVSYLKE